jgi:hypothetical protein
VVILIVSGLRDPDEVARRVAERAVAGKTLSESNGKPRVQPLWLDSAGEHRPEPSVSSTAAQGGETMPSLDWNEPDSFEKRAIYRHAESNRPVEFLGVASMPELDGEDVGIFRFTEGGGFLVATKRSRGQRATFTPIAEDPVEEDEASTAEWRAFVEGKES